MKAFITGITGFLGSALDAALRAQGWSTAGASQSTYRLGDPFDPSQVTDSDLVIHAAHDFTPGSLQRNLLGTLAVFDAAASRPLVRQIFISSYSASSDSGAEYGRIKHAVESALHARGAVIVRPGLVVGNGGLFARNLRFILKSPVIPLVAGSRNRIPVIALADFLEAMLHLASSASPASQWNLFHPELVTMRSLVQETLHAAGRHAAIIDLPAGLALAGLRAASLVGVKLPVDAGNLRALRSNQQRPLPSRLLELIPRPLTLAEMTSAAVQSYRASITRPEAQP